MFQRLRLWFAQILVGKVGVIYNVHIALKDGEVQFFSRHHGEAIILSEASLLDDTKVRLNSRLPAMTVITKG
jgi:hypothetical protein